MSILPFWLPYVFVFAFGSIIGSFLNVCIWRLPRGESIVFPPSRCPDCGARIRPRDNVPILSWLLLRGRCRDCRGGISPIYPSVELITALLFVIYLRRFGTTPAVIPWLVFAAALVVIFFIDLEHQIIPDVISLPGMAAGLLFTPLLPRTLLEGAIGLLAGGLFFYLTAVISAWVLKQEGMGGGDIKMAAMMGAFLGWKDLIVAVFLALLLGSLVGITLMLLGRRGRRDAIPFGPFLAIGAVAASLWGAAIIDWYLNMRFS